MRTLALAVGLLAVAANAQPADPGDGAAVAGLAGAGAELGRFGGRWLITVDQDGHRIAISPILCEPACRGLRLSGELAPPLPTLVDLQHWNATRPLTRAVLDDQVGTARLTIDHFAPDGIEAATLETLIDRLARDLDAFAAEGGGTPGDPLADPATDAP